MEPLYILPQLPFYSRWRSSSTLFFTQHAFLLTVVLLCLLSFTFSTNGWTQPTVIVVNSTGDAADANAGIDKICDDGTGACTLRAAIQTHNGNRLNANTITFNIPIPAGAATALINVQGPLPPVLGQVHIDGTTQPGYDPLTGLPKIEIDGSLAGATGIVISGTGTILEGVNIHSFAGRGIQVSATGGLAENIIIRRNFIGTDPTGTLDKGNGNGGILLLASFGVQNVEIVDNLISGNGGPGVELDQVNTDGSNDISNNTIHGNKIGTDVAGNAAIPNDGEGILMHHGAHGNFIGNQGNIISGNLLGGVVIAGAGSDNNLVRNNRIGVNANGNAALGNGIGVQIREGAQFNEIGGSLAGQGNHISGNVTYGVLITGTGTDDNRVQDNLIGPNRLRDAALPNDSSGVAILNGAQDNVVTDNTVEGNNRHGILISGTGTNSNEILANFIGSASLPNQMDGVQIAAGAQINLISQNNIGNNTLNGITLTGNGTDGNTVTANIILGNERSGVRLDAGAALNFIGGFIAGAQNSIQGNIEPGVVVTGGVSNSIMNNAISFNGLAGIAVLAGTGNAILSNSIFSNVAIPIPSLPVNGLGIDLGGLTGIAGDNGVTPNDPTDADSGPNNLQNFPVLSTVTLNNGQLSIQGSLHSTPNTTFRIEFFSNEACDPSGFGEGKTFLGFNQLTTDAAGNILFTVSFPDTSAFVAGVTATATDPLGNTSEFAFCLPVGAPAVADLEVTKQASKTQLTIGESVTFTITLTNKGPDNATGIALTDIAPTGITFDQVTPSVGNYNTSTGIWTIEALAAGSQAVLSIVATPIQTGTITNTAELTASNQTDPDSQPGNGVAAEDDQSSISITVIEEIPVAQQLGQLIAKVQALVIAGELTRQEGRLLIGLLELSVKFQAKGNDKATISALRVFMLLTKTLVRKNRLSAEEGNELIMTAESIINQLKAPAILAENNSNLTLNSEENKVEEIKGFKLHPTYPNPFSTTTIIPFELSQESSVQLIICNAQGKVIHTLLNTSMPAGLHELTWQASDLPSGMYILQVQVDGVAETRQLVHVQ